MKTLAPHAAPGPLARALRALALPVLALSTLAPAGSAQEFDGEGLKSAIRASVRWLRSSQDPIVGTYGDGVESTALSVKALALSPDQYRYQDGPFIGTAIDYLCKQQAEDGSFGGASLGDGERRRLTRLAVEAMMLAPHASSVEALAKGLRYLGESADDWDLRGRPDREDVEAPMMLAQTILGGRERGEVFWNDERGKVIATAEKVIELSALMPRSSGSSRPPAEIDELPPFDPATRKEAEVAQRYGAQFLASLADGRGRFGAPGQPHLGLTAMALSALATVPEPRPESIQDTLDRGLLWLVGNQNDDGSIHDGQLANYATSASIMALSRADAEQYSGVIARASAFLQGLQLDDEEGYSEGDVYYGGIGYGSTERPDLSNLQMALEALSESGLEEGASTYTKALQFLQRTQNRSETNDVRIVDGKVVITSGDDGGAGYMPGDSKAGFVELEDGTQVPRSYGSMTYALLKCYALAGLDKSDPRMKAALDWCRANYTLEINPGFEHLSDPTAAYQGLYYYLLTMAQALSATGDDFIVSTDGVRHHWRAEICGRIIAMRNSIDGSWINRNSARWYEGNPILATSYALLTLDVAMPKAR